MSIIKNNKGFALLEMIICFPVLIILLYTIIYLSEISILKGKTLIASRYVAWELAKNYSSTNVENSIDEKVKELFFKNYEHDLTIHSQEYFRSIPEDLTKIQKTYFKTLLPLSFVGEVTYNLPMKFGPIKFNCNDIFGLNISSNHYISSNSWNGWENSQHDHFDDVILSRLKEDLYFLLR